MTGLARGGLDYFMFGFDLESLIRTVGYLGITAIVYAETGLLAGFFLPGDSLLFTAGLLASQGVLNPWLLIPLVFVAAVAGDATGYAIGHRYGRRVLESGRIPLVTANHVQQAESFFATHGPKSVVLARFIPIVRTFVPVLAGIGRMGYRTFATYNVVGALLWGVGVTIAGYFLGSVIPDVDRYLLPIILVIIVASFIPAVWHWQSARSKAVR